jgi:hypothetical protein
MEKSSTAELGSDPASHEVTHIYGSRSFISVKYRIFWDVAPCSQVDVDGRFRGITLMMEAVRISETPVNINLTTWRYILEVSKLHTRRRENLKFYYRVHKSPPPDLIWYTLIHTSS